MSTNTHGLNTVQAKPSEVKRNQSKNSKLWATKRRSFTLHCSEVKKVWWLVVDFVFHHFTKLCLVSFYSFMLRFFLYFSGGFCHDPVWRRRRRRRSVFSKESAFLGGVPHASKTPFLSVVSPLLMENGHWDTIASRILSLRLSYHSKLLNSLTILTSLRWE